jgi:uncharacterized protein (TIGR02001 family)
MKTPAWCALALVGLLSTPAFAEDAPVSFEAEVAVVSDYRFRGLSLSDSDPALQGGLTAALAGGAYAYVWGSTIEEYGAGADGDGAKVEVDFVLGWAGQAAGLDLDVSVQAYVYPGGSDVSYIEIPVSASRTVGDWTWTLGAAYAPSQKALGHEDNAYGWAGLAWAAEDAPFEVELTAGYEDGAYAPGGKWDWSAGVKRGLGPVTAGLAYVDSDAGSAGAVVSLTTVF